MTNKETELVIQLTEVAKTVAELKAENKILKDINEKLMQALRIHDVGKSEQLVCPCCGSDKTYKTDAIHCNICAVTTEIYGN